MRHGVYNGSTNFKEHLTYAEDRLTGPYSEKTSCFGVCRGCIHFFIRVAQGDQWPAPGTQLPVYPTLVNTCILISSSFTMHWAQTSIKKGNRFGLKAGILTTFLLGVTFLFLQVNEYANIGFAPQDAAQQTIFYSLTGLHGAHVTIGLILLAIVTIRSWRGHYTPEEHRGVEVPGIYWHFVDIMWIVVYFTVYIV